MEPRTRTQPANDLHVDDLDERILWELARDARTPNNVLADRLGVSPSTTLARTKSLRRRGILRSSHAGIDLRAVGLPIQAVIAVRLRVQARPQVKTYAAKVVRLPHVLSVYFLGGPDDFLIHVACTSPEQLRDFVSAQLSTDIAVASTQTNLVFDYLDGGDYMDREGSFDVIRAPLS